MLLSHLPLHCQQYFMAASFIGMGNQSIWRKLYRPTESHFVIHVFSCIEYTYIYNIRTLSVNIQFICTSFRDRQNNEPLASFSGLFRSEYKRILYLTTMYVFCVYPAMSKKSENLSDLDKKDRNKRHSSPFINVVQGVFFVFRVTLVPVSYLSAPSTVYSYRVPGKFIRIVRKVYSSSTNKAKIYSYSIFVQQMY